MPQEIVLTQKQPAHHQASAKWPAYCEISMPVHDTVFNQSETMSIKLKAHAGAQWLVRSLAPGGDKNVWCLEVAREYAKA